MFKILAIVVGAAVLLVGVAFVALFVTLVIRIRREMAASFAAAVAEKEAAGDYGGLSSHTSVFGFPISFSTHYQAKPRRYRRNGASHVRHCVQRLIASNAPHTWLYFYSSGRHSGFSLEKYVSEPWEEAFEIRMMFNRLQDPACESIARAFFDDLDIDPRWDSLEGSPTCPTRVLIWPIGAPVEQLPVLCQTILSDLCQVTPGEALNITYNDRQDDRII